MTWRPEQIGRTWVASQVLTSANGITRVRDTETFDTQAQAAARCAKLNGTRAPRVVSEGDFFLAFAGSTSSRTIRDACYDLIVLGRTWVDVRRRYGVSNGGIHKALRAVGLR